MPFAESQRSPQLRRMKTTEQLVKYLCRLIREHIEDKQRADSVHLADASLSLGAAVAHFEQIHIQRVVNLSHGDRRVAARRLGIGYSTLKAKFSRMEKDAPKTRRGGGLATGPGKRLNMSCRVEGCRRRSRGPRFGFICDEHRKSLTAARQLAARQAWREKQLRRGR